MSGREETGTWPTEFVLDVVYMLFYVCYLFLDVLYMLCICVYVLFNMFLCVFKLCFICFICGLFVPYMFYYVSTM